MGLVVAGIAVCTIAVTIMMYIFVCFVNEISNINNLAIALTLGFALMALLGIGMLMIQEGMTEQKTIQVESGDISES